LEVKRIIATILVPDQSKEEPTMSARELRSENLEPRHLLTTFTPTLLADFSSGSASSEFSDFAPVGDTMLFTVNGGELWMTDGSPVGTGSVAENGFVEGEQIQAIGLSFFQVQSSAIPTVWRTDGTIGGTFEIAQGKLLSLDSELDGIAYLQIEVAGNSLLWKTDGTATGTVQTAPLAPPTLDAAGNLYDANGTLFMSIDRALSPFPVGDELYFFVFEHGDFSATPWVSDGTLAGTTPLTGSPIEAGRFSWLDEHDGDLWFLASGSTITAHIIDRATQTVSAVNLATPSNPDFAAPSLSVGFGFSVGWGTTKTEQAMYIQVDVSSRLHPSDNDVTIWRTNAGGLEYVGYQNGREVWYASNIARITVDEVAGGDRISYSGARYDVYGRDGTITRLPSFPFQRGLHLNPLFEKDAIASVGGDADAYGLYWNENRIDGGVEDYVSTPFRVLSLSSSSILYSRSNGGTAVWGASRDTSAMSLEFLDVDDVEPAVADEFGHYFFRGNPGSRSLWASDGTQAGTSRVDIWSDSPTPQLIEWSSGRTLVVATDENAGQELFVIDANTNDASDFALVHGTIDTNAGDLQVTAVNINDGTTYYSRVPELSDSATNEFTMKLPAVSSGQAATYSITVQQTQLIDREFTRQILVAYNVEIDGALVELALDATDGIPDQYVDIVGLDQSEKFWVAESDNGVSTQTKFYGQWPTGTTFTDFGSGDFNGDGRIDVVGRTTDGTLKVAIATGGSNFAFADWGNLTANVSWSNFHVGDFNGDGRDDVIVRADSNGSWWLAASTGQGFKNAHWGTHTTAIDWEFVFGDFSGNGREEIAALAPGGTWWLSSKANGEARFNSSYWGKWSPGDWDEIVVGDFLGTGRDVVAGLAANSFWWVGGGSQPFQQWTTWDPSIAWEHVQVGDFNGDDKDDIAGRGNGNWLVGLSTPAVNMFAVHYFAFGNAAIQWNDVQVVDFNADGTEDIIGRATNGQWWVFQSNGSSFGGVLAATWSPEHELI